MTQYTYISRSWQLGSDVREIFDYEGWEPDIVGSGVPPGLSCTTYYWYQIDIGRITISGVPSQVGTYTFDVVGWGETPDPQVKRFTITIWQPTYTHTIAYNANGGSGSMGNTTVTDTNSGNSNVTFANNGFTAPTGKHFIGWRIDNTGPLYQPGNTYAVGGNGSVTAYAQWETNTYTVTWKNWDNTVLETDTGVAYGTTPTYNGATPTRASTAQYAYTFTGWSPTVGAITGDTTYTAQFSSAVRTYTITWKNHDGTVLETDTGVAYGATPTYNGSTPTKPSTAQYTYTFSGWSPTVASVTSDATYTAQFSSTVRSYTVTLTSNGNGTVSGGGTYTYGSTVNISATPDANYVFSTWSDGNTNASRSLTVTGNVSLSATFAPAIAKINVKVNGSWVKGSVYVKVNGSWVESKHIYINDNGTWKESVD